MKRFTISFDVEVERDERDMTESKLKEDVKRTLFVYGRSNGLCVENVTFVEKEIPFGDVSFSCRGFDCALRNNCRRHLKWCKVGDYSFVDYCDPDTRPSYLPLKRQ